MQHEAASPWSRAGSFLRIQFSGSSGDARPLALRAALACSLSFGAAGARFPRASVTSLGGVGGVRAAHHIMACFHIDLHVMVLCLSHRRSVPKAQSFSEKDIIPLRLSYYSRLTRKISARLNLPAGQAASSVAVTRLQ